MEPSDATQLITPKGTFLIKFASDTAKQGWVKLQNSLLREIIGGREGKAIIGMCYYCY